MVNRTSVPSCICHRHKLRGSIATVPEHARVLENTMQCIAGREEKPYICLEGLLKLLGVDFGAFCVHHDCHRVPAQTFSLDVSFSNRPDPIL